MLTWVESADKLKRSASISLLFFKAALNLTLLDDVEVVTLVTLVEHKLLSLNIFNLQAVDKFKFVVLLKALEELHLVEVLKTDVSTTDGVDCDNLLEDIS